MQMCNLYYYNREYDEYKIANSIKHNCIMCAYFENDALYKYTYDFSNKKKDVLKLDCNGYCFLGFDKLLGDNQIDTFDREIERECSVLGVLQTALLDKDLQKAKNNEELVKMFKEKYQER